MTTNEMTPEQLEKAICDFEDLSSKIVSTEDWYVVKALGPQFAEKATNLLPHLIKAYRDNQKEIIFLTRGLSAVDQIVKDLQKSYDQQQKQLSQKDAVIEKMREALSFYADDKNWLGCDDGYFKELVLKQHGSTRAGLCLAEINSTEKKEGE